MTVGISSRRRSLGTVYTHVHNEDCGEDSLMVVIYGVTDVCDKVDAYGDKEPSIFCSDNKQISRK